MGPIDYGGAIADPISSALDGYKTGLAIQDDLIRRQAAQKAAVESQRAGEQWKKDLSYMAENPFMPAAERGALMARNPNQIAFFKDTFNQLDSAKQQESLSQANQVHAALLQKKPQFALEILDKQREAYQNSGRTQDAEGIKNLAELVRSDPDRAVMSSTLFLSSIFGPEKYAENFNKFSESQREEKKLPSEIAKLQSEAGLRFAETQAKNAEAAYLPEKQQIDAAIAQKNLQNLDSQIKERAARFGLDEDKIKADLELKVSELNNRQSSVAPEATKLINEAVLSASADAQQAERLRDLAKRVATSGAWSGAPGKAAAWLKEATGSEDYLTNLQKEYITLRNTQAVRMLPPGSASDKDISLFLGGFLKPDASPEAMTSFLKGMAKVQDASAAGADARAEWLGTVGSLANSRREAEISGIKIAPGAKFNDFARVFVAKKLQNDLAEKSLANVQGRSYMQGIGRPSGGGAEGGF